MAAKSSDKRRYRRTHPTIRKQIETLAASDPELSAQQIADHLADMDLPGDLPNLRTIQLIAATARPRRPDEPWTLVDPRAPADESKMVLETLGSVVRLRGDSVVLSVAEAQWIARLGKVAPWLSAFERYVYGRRYLAAIEQDSPTDALTHEIARLSPETLEQASRTLSADIRQAYTALKEQRQAKEQA